MPAAVLVLVVSMVLILAMKSSGQDGKELLTGLMLELANPT